MTFHWIVFFNSLPDVLRDEASDFHAHAYEAASECKQLYELVDVSA